MPPPQGQKPLPKIRRRPALAALGPGRAVMQAWGIGLMRQLVEQRPSDGVATEFDANFGAYYSFFGVDIGASYGRSEDLAPAWQSAGALYNSSVTVWYKPDRFPGISATVAAGNFDHKAFAYGGPESDLYGATNNGEFWSVTAGLDLTNVLWSPEASEINALNGQRASVKLLYRYSGNLYQYSDSLAGSSPGLDEGQR